MVNCEFAFFRKSIKKDYMKWLYPKWGCSCCGGSNSCHS